MSIEEYALPLFAKWPFRQFLIYLQNLSWIIEIKIKTNNKYTAYTYKSTVDITIDKLDTQSL